VTLVEGPTMLGNMPGQLALSARPNAQISGQNLFFAFIYNTLGVPLGGRRALIPVVSALLSEPMIAAAAMKDTVIGFGDSATRCACAPCETSEIFKTMTTHRTQETKPPNVLARIEGQVAGRRQDGWGEDRYCVDIVRAGAGDQGGTDRDTSRTDSRRPISRTWRRAMPSGRWRSQCAARKVEELVAVRGRAKE